MKRMFSLLVAVVLICALAVPVSAAESEDGTWVELLETGFVNGGSHNYFDYVTTKTIEIKTPSNMRICKIDMLMTYSVGSLPSKVEFNNLNGWTRLTIKEIGPGLARIYGTVRSTFYGSVQIRFTRTATTTTYCELLSCKVSRISTQDFVADADMYIDGGLVPQQSAYTYDGGYEGHYIEQNQVRVNVYDWSKFDQLTIWGSSAFMPINSIRATVGTLGLPFTVSYMDMASPGSFNYAHGNSQGGALTDGYGYEYDTWEDYFIDIDSVSNTNAKWLYCITIDLTGVDRTLGKDPLYVYLTGFFDEFYGYSFTLQYVNGSIIVPDTSDATWWTRFTAFMRDLFGADQNSDALDDLGGTSDSISQSASDIHNFEQSQQAVLDNNFSVIQNTITFTNFAAALVFVQKYANLTVSGLSKYMVVFTLPLFLGLFFYLCSRVPGITRWKPRPPQKKGGNSP